MILSLIVAASENDVIGRDNNLIWHLSADLKRFKSLTTGHTVIMGRKTFESIGKALPNRRNIVISRNPAYVAHGCEQAVSIEAALELVKGEEEVFVIGGGSIYHALWNCADKLYLTRVHLTTMGDTTIPRLKESMWELVSTSAQGCDEKNEFACTFLDYRRKD